MSEAIVHGFAAELIVRPAFRTYMAVDVQHACAALLRGQSEDQSMLRWALFFLVIAIIAAIFGFGGIASAAVGIAKVLFFIFVVIFIVLLVAGLLTGKAIF
jgi:uncharacterized membrane protein YtjA (UPF0391 family)